MSARPRSGILRPALEKAARALLLAALVLAPLPLASVIPAARAGLALVSGLALAAMAAAVLLSGPAPRQAAAMKLLCWTGAGFGVVVAWAAIQALPAPFPGWVHPAWKIATTHTGGMGAISPNPAETFSAILDISAVAALFGAAVLAFHDVRTARAAFAALVLSATAYAVYGLTAYSAGGDSVLWIERFAHDGSVTGPFVGRNAFAAYLALAAAAAVLLVLSRTHIPARGERPGNHLAVALASAFEHGWLWIACLPVLTVAAVFTGSRMGAAVFALGILTGGTLYLRSSRAASAGRLAAGGLVLLSCGIVIALATNATLSERISQQGIASPDRPLIYRLTAEGIAAAPLIGHGYGTYEESFRAYSETPELFRSSVNFAHNTYLELAFELGIPVALVLLACIAAIVRRCYLGVRDRRRDRMYAVYGLTATTMIGLHSLIDFPAQVPAVAACLAILGGACVAQSYPSPGARNG